MIKLLKHSNQSYQKAIVTKFWSRVEERLLTRKGPIYYMGGTLVIGFDNGGIGLNLNGQGFVFHHKEYPYFKNDKVYMPEHITKLVRSIYIEAKGKNDHYKESVKKH